MNSPIFPTRKYNLEYFVNGTKKETVLQNVTRPLALWKRKELEESGNYSFGKLILSSIKK